MYDKQITIRQLWDRQQIAASDVDYSLWDCQRESICQMSHLISGCIFTVDVFRGIYDFASDRFSELFGFDPQHIRTIQTQGDLLEERIHPDDRQQLFDFQIDHGRFIYTLPAVQRNDFQQIFQYRMLNSKQQYVNVISRQQVIRQDNYGKAWMIMGMMDISPDQTQTGKVKRTLVNRQTGELVCASETLLQPENHQEIPSLTKREREILLLIHKGMLSKEIADRLCVSIYTVHNHRKNILARLHANNSIEAIAHAKKYGIL